MLDAYGLTLMGCQFQRESLIQKQPTKWPLHPNFWFHLVLVMVQSNLAVQLSIVEQIFGLNVFGELCEQPLLQLVGSYHRILNRTELYVLVIRIYCHPSPIIWRHLWTGDKMRDYNIKEELWYITFLVHNTIIFTIFAYHLIYIYGKSNQQNKRGVDRKKDEAKMVCKKTGREFSIENSYVCNRHQPALNCYSK